MAVVQAEPGGGLRLTQPADSDERPLALGALEGGARQTLTDRAVAAIRAAIVDGRLRAGELYSVARLAERLQVSRTPVREALLLLERQGMVRFERNRGARVLESSAHDLDEVFALRLLLEVPAARRAAELLGETELEQLTQILAAMRSTSATPTSAPSWPTTDASTSCCWRPPATAASSASSARCATSSASAAPRPSAAAATSRAIYDEHVRILDALRAGDPEAVGTAMRDHLVHTRELLLAADPAGDPAAEDGAAGETPWPARLS